MELTFDARCTSQGKPFVAIILDGKELGQLDPDTCQQLGLRAIQAGIEAERDAGFFKFMRVLDPSPDGLQAAGAMLHGLREHRAQYDPTAPIFPNDPRVS